MSTNDPRQFYNTVMPSKFGADYEFSRWHKNPIQHAGYELTKRSIQTHVLGKDASTPHRVIELGPGAGTWTKMLVGKFSDSEYVLVDISKEMLERAQKTLESTFPQASVKYMESDFLEFNDTRGCDLFFSSRVLEYIHDKHAFVEKVAELLNTGGKGYVITKMPHYDREKMLGRRAQRFHLGQINPLALTGLFEEAGLLVRAVYPVTVSIPIFHSALLNRLAGNLFQRWQLNWFTGFFSESYCVIVEKPQ